jgi:hypothetical protein
MHCGSAPGFDGAGPVAFGKVMSAGRYLLKPLQPTQTAWQVSVQPAVQAVSQPPWQPPWQLCMQEGHFSLGLQDCSQVVEQLSPWAVQETLQLTSHMDLQPAASQADLQTNLHVPVQSFLSSGRGMDKSVKSCLM